MSETETNEPSAEANGALSELPSGRGVHITCSVLTLIGAGAGLLLESGSPGEFLGVILLIVTLYAWGWYSGPWRTVARTGKPGWLSVVPVLNGLTFLEVARKPGWWLPLWIVPGAQLVVGGAVLHALARRFGRSALLPVLLFLGASAPFYMASMTWFHVGVSEGLQGKYGMIAGLSVKAFIVGVHISILIGCLPLGLGRARTADEAIEA